MLQAQGQKTEDMSTCWSSDPRFSVGFFYEYRVAQKNVWEADRDFYKFRLVNATFSSQLVKRSAARRGEQFNSIRFYYYNSSGKHR